MPDNDDSNSGEFLARLEANDQTAWALFVERYTEPFAEFVRRTLPARIRRKVGDEDIVQEVFRDLFLDSCRGQLSFDDKPSLWRILRHRVSRRIRHEVRKFLAARRDVRRETP